MDEANALGGPIVLRKKRCPHTGITNFFTDAEPFLAVGSVSETGSSASYTWRCYLDDEASGVSADISLAEAHLRLAIANREHGPAKSSSRPTFYA